MFTERKRYMLEFGRAKGHQWYSTSPEDLLKDFRDLDLERKLVPALYEVRELIDLNGFVLEREDKPIKLQ